MGGGGGEHASTSCCSPTQQTCNTHRNRNRNRHRDTHTHGQTHTHMDTDTQTDRHRHTDRHTQTHRQTHTHRPGSSPPPSFLPSQCTPQAGLLHRLLPPALTPQYLTISSPHRTHTSVPHSFQPTPHSLFPTCALSTTLYVMATIRSTSMSAGSWLSSSATRLLSCTARGKGSGGDSLGRAGRVGIGNEAFACLPGPPLQT